MLYPIARPGLTAAARTRSERPTGQEKKKREYQARGVLQRDDAPGIGGLDALQECGSRAWGRFNFRFAKNNRSKSV